MNPIYALDKARPAFSQLYDVGPPNLVFIGASQPHHLRETLTNTKLSSRLPYKVTDFLSASEFIAVGGLKWWSLIDELQGNFTNPRKWAKYGDQWLNYTATNHKADIAVLFNGSYDVDDLNNCTLSALPNGLYNIDFNLCADAITEKWFLELSPVIHESILHIQHLLPHAKLFYYPIIPREWWHPEARKFANMLDYYITVTLRMKHNIRVKMLSNKTLYSYPASSVYDNVKKNINPDFWIMITCI